MYRFQTISVKIPSLDMGFHGLLSHVQLFVTLCTAARQASMSITNSWSLLKLMSIESVMPSNHLILSRPLLLSPSIFSASGSFTMSQLFASASASASVLPMNIQGWFPLGLTSWISLQFKGLSRAFSNTQFKSINLSAFSFLYSPSFTSIRDYWKNRSFD